MAGPTRRIRSCLHTRKTRFCTMHRQDRRNSEKQMKITRTPVTGYVSFAMGWQGMRNRSTVPKGEWAQERNVRQKRLRVGYVANNRASRTEVLQISLALISNEGLTFLIDEICTESPRRWWIVPLAPLTGGHRNHWSRDDMLHIPGAM